MCFKSSSRSSDHLPSVPLACCRGATKPGCQMGLAPHPACAGAQAIPLLVSGGGVGWVLLLIRARLGPSPPLPSPPLPPADLPPPPPPVPSLPPQSSLCPFVRRIPPLLIGVGFGFVTSQLTPGHVVGRKFSMSLSTPPPPTTPPHPSSTPDDDNCCDSESTEPLVVRT
ncbi:hypothetical protein BDZ91DRAFT_821343 [Kalaharituber pfeilii]|nr:hypothetical protein BDZ91DRAFT_821343 [Kalaharituber pfeilii]